ncbi:MULTISPECIES: hypothetical protein [Aeromonas]|jgi:hypothetical protein|uniref:hypothetical protein n=1 Tax=Aeromonas TaxID=642 RepID=UPI0030CA7539
MTNDMLVQLLGWLGLILSSPMLYRMFYLLCMLIGRALRNQQEITIQHVHDGRLVSSVTLRLDSKEPLIRQLNAISAQRDGENSGD